MTKPALGVLGWFVRKRVLTAKITQTRSQTVPADPSAADYPSRPEGKLIWLHVSNETTLRECGELLESFHDLGWNCVVTSDADLSQDLLELTCGSVVFGRDKRRVSKKFLQHWRPDAGIWASNRMRGAMVMETARLSIPLIYVNAMPVLEPRGWRASLPSLSRAILERFIAILAISEEANKRLIGFGISKSKIEVTGRLRSLLGSKTLPVEEQERSTMARQLAGRSVWFANSVSIEELPFVLTAHKRATRTVQNLLLILRMDQQAKEADVDRIIGAANAPFLRRSIEEFPKPMTSIFIADEPEEEGLWYRVAPVTFLGGSLSSGVSVNPFEAAALGSAIICGPKWGSFALVCRRLADAGAVSTIAHEDALGVKLSAIIQPDAAARLAHAAWEVTSAGAEVHDRILELLHSAIDGEEAPDEAA